MLRIHQWLPLVRNGKRRIGDGNSIRAVGLARKPLADIDAALFLPGLRYE
jgi:hypothetical protein